MFMFDFINTRSFRVGSFLILLLICVTFTLKQLQSDVDVQTPIKKSHELIEAGKYYDALLALKPLLTSDQKSEAQEDALWLAHQLGDKVTGMIDSELQANYHRMAKAGKTDLARQAEKKTFKAKVKPLNELGARIYDYAEMQDRHYDKGFLQRLIDEYPKTLKRPFAEYELIFTGEGIPRSGFAEDTLKTLYDYISKYEKTGRVEVYRAYLDLAHLHHGLWAVLTYPDEPGPSGGMGAGYTSDDPEEDKKRAAEHRSEAIKYYALYHLNPHRLPADESYQRLKNNEEFGWFYVVWGC